MKDSPEELTPEAARLFEALLAERRPEEPAAAPSRLPLSAVQRRLWELGRLTAGSPWGNLPLVFRVRGPLDLDAMQAALAALLKRHESLRMRFEQAGGEVVGRIAPVEGRVLDVAPRRADVDPEEARSAALARIRDEATRPMDPLREPIFRARWLPLGEADGFLFLLTHHLAADGWSLGLLLREFSALYRAKVLDGDPCLAKPGASLAEVVGAEQTAPPPDDEALGYWERRLAGAPREVPLDGAGKNEETGEADGGFATRTGTVRHELEPGAASDLSRLAASSGVTPFAAWLAVFGATLAAYTEEPDIVLGTTISDRAGSEREGLVANLGNNLLLRTRFDPEAAFVDVLNGLATTLPRDLAHQRVTLERLLRHVAGRTRLPRLNVLFMLRDGSPNAHFDLTGCDVAYVPLDVGASALDLILDVEDLGEEGFAYSIEHRRARVPEREAKALSDDLAAVVETVAADPGHLLADLPAKRGRWAPGPPEPAGAPPRGAGKSSPEMSPSEEALASLWREVLDVDEVGPFDNFFELGGHSLLALDVLEQIEERTGVKLTPVDLVSQTLGQLAAAVDEGTGVAAEGSDSGTEREERWWSRWRDARRGR